MLPHNPDQPNDADSSANDFPDVIKLDSHDGSLRQEVDESTVTTATTETEPERLTGDSAEESATSSDDEPYFRELTPADNTLVEAPVFSPLRDKDRRPVREEDFISLLNVDVAELNTLTQNFKQLDVLSNEEGDEYLDMIREGQANLLRGQALLGSIMRTTALWTQAVTADGQKIKLSNPKFGESGEGGRLVGEAAMIKVQAMTGLGQVVRVPLWHSGIWLTIKAPTEAQLLELDRRIQMEKIEMGRRTAGLIFSNMSVYHNSFLVNFVLAQTFEATVKYTKVDELKSLIRVTDIPTMIWGLLCATYPQGHRFRQPCVADPTKCRHVLEEMLNISKLCFTDDRVLSDSQRKFMTQRLAKHNPEQIENYQKEHKFNTHSVLELQKADRANEVPSIVVALKVPSIAEYERSGFAWVDGTVAAIDEAFGGTLKGQERNDYILERGYATALRQYGYWIEKIVMNDGKDVIDEPQTIEDVIGALTGNQDIYTAFLEGVRKFIDITTISLIGIPKFDCPSCGKPPTEEYSRHPNLIALDVANVFFTLIDRRVFKVLTRRS